MAFNTLTTALGNWIDENSQDLITKAVLEAYTINYLPSTSIYTGIKYKKQVKFLETDALIQAQANCTDIVNSGTTSLTDKDITVYKLSVAETISPIDLENTSLQLSMDQGTNQKIPFEVQWTDLKIKMINKAIEQMIWANSASGTTNCEGWIYMMEADSDVNDRTFSWSGTTFTADDYSDEVYGMINDLPAEIQIKDDLTLFVPYEVSRKMIQAFVKDGNYHINFVDKDGNSDWYFPGTNVVVRPTYGLVGTNAVVLTPASNLIVGTDLQDEQEDLMELWWERKARCIYFLSNFKIGVSYFFGEYIVLSNA